MTFSVIKGRPLNVTKAMGEHEAKQADQARKDMIQRKIERKSKTIFLLL